MNRGAWRERLGRIDTLFLRLFLLMWATLVISHLVAFSVVSPVGAGWLARLPTQGVAALPPLPSLPPAGPLGAALGRHGEARQGTGGAPPAAGDSPGASVEAGGWRHGRRGMSEGALWLDFALRTLLIGLGAAIGARWLAAPMRRLALVSTTLSQGLAEGRDPPTLDERTGTVEVRDSARAFNHMARALKHQFEQRSLHMAAVSHDLRTPLTRLRLRLEQLPQAAAQAAAQDIRAMDGLIDASLAVMREQSTAAPPALMDLRALLQSLADDRQALGQPVTLAEPEGGSAPAALRVRAHPASLQRIVDNLVDNALRYGRLARLDGVADGDTVVVTVDDDGPGIASDQRERVQQAWVRLPQGGAAPGSGLGLAIARDLAQREGGRLALENRAEGGLRVTLTLPRA